MQKKIYSITEKEFMAIAYGIEYIEMHLKGRKFKVIYDHTALTYAKIKHIFGNMKLERMRVSRYHHDLASLAACSSKFLDFEKNIYF
jgi:glycyl-tRNA synthetase alpha subunit